MAQHQYSFLGPAGTFTETALRQVPDAAGKPWHPAHNVGEAFADVVSGRSVAAMIAIENSIDGGVSAAHDALIKHRNLRIIGEYLVPVNFVLVAHLHTRLSDITTVHAHPVAYAQCQNWLTSHLPHHEHIPESSNVSAASSLLEPTSLETTPHTDAAIAPPTITDQHPTLEKLAENIGDNSHAVTRFVLVSRSSTVRHKTGADKTSLIVELLNDETGALLTMLEQFSTRGVNLSFIHSRPIGDGLGRYRFVIDIDGHIDDERVADALLGLRRSSADIIFLGSYPRANKTVVQCIPQYNDSVFREARAWLNGLISSEESENKAL